MNRKTYRLLLAFLPIFFCGCRNYDFESKNRCKERCSLADARIIESFENDAAFTDRFRPGNGIDSLEIARERIAHYPEHLYEGKPCLQAFFSNEPARSPKTVFYKLKEPLETDRFPALSFGFCCSGEAPSDRYFIQLLLRNDSKTYTCQARIDPFRWNTVTFDLSETAVPERVTEIGFICWNDSPEPWSGSFQIGTIRQGKAYDLFFDTQRTADLFQANNGTVTQQDGVLEYRFGIGSTLSSPLLSGSRNRLYNPPLEKRNTLFFVLENQSSASELCVRFITETDTVYDDAKSKRFPIAPYAPMQACYFNLSDLPTARGSLLGFRIEPLHGTGTIRIDRISFEEEAKLELFAGTIDSCTATSSVISVTGTVRPDFQKRYRSIAIYETEMNRSHDSIAGLPCLYEGMMTDTFRITDIPLRKGNRTRLGSQFLAVVKNGENDFCKIAPRFYITNWRSFEENPYAFSLPDRNVDVCRFGAKGDGFTDDTKSIQAAIDFVASQGGGRVTLPGDTSFYGRRYVVTNIRLRSHIDLHLEKGALLWQSQNESDYAYHPEYGHDTHIAGVIWSHCMLSSNLPLILAQQVENIKITGQGSIRMADTYSHNQADGEWFTAFCSERIHAVPIGCWKVRNIEVSDLEIIRSNTYHTSFYTCSNLFAGNLRLHEARCLNGDGFGLGVGTHDVKICRCLLESNDDGVVLWASYDDPRGTLWWFSQPGADNSIFNVTVCHSYFNSGTAKAIAFIPWGSEDPYPEREEIRNIEIYDNTLLGANSVGVWADNPYRGSFPFTNDDRDDYSPIKQVRIHDNDYRNPCTFLWVEASDVVTDCGIRSASAFLNNDFAQGRAHWSVKGDAGVNDGTGYVRNGRLYEGLYLPAGSHTFTARVKGDGRLFAERALQETEKTEQPFSNTSWTTQTLSFETTEPGTWLLGIEGPDGLLQSVSLDNEPVRRLNSGTESVEPQ